MNNFKNNRIKELLIKQANNESISFDNKTYQEIGEIIISGYWSSLIDVSEKMPKDTQIDFTYATLKNLPLVLSLFLKESKENNPQEAIYEILIKTIASYWYGLGMNEHNCELKVKEGNGKNPPYWADEFLIKVGTIKEENFLIETIKMFNLPFEAENKIFLDMTPIINAYKNAFGIDLNDYGIANMAI